MTKEIITLGTTCMQPTKERSHISNALFYEGEIFIFDCGENTQLQIKKAKLPIGSITKIFISHWHGDHTLGLNGLMQTLSNTENFKYLEIHGPPQSKKFISHMIKSTIFKPKFEYKIFEYKLNDTQIKKIVDNEKYEIFTTKLNHSVPCLGYSFVEKNTINLDKKKLIDLKIEKDIKKLTDLKKGLDIKILDKNYKNKFFTYIKKGVKICFVFDTRPCKNIDKLILNADYLIMEATFLYKTHKKKAIDYDHMSSFETAKIAKKNKVKTLIITHFSQRYNGDELLEEAKKVFENTIQAKDLLRIMIKK